MDLTAPQGLYRPFIDDPVHISLLEGQRYVVLRAIGAVRDAYVELQATIEEELAGLDVSYPAEPHVTLLGLGDGTDVEAVRELVSDWAASVPPLDLEVEKVSVFPTPYQIVIVQVRKNPELVRAMSSLRGRAQQRGLVDLAKIAPSDWVFHLSVAYCSSLSAASWANVKQYVDALIVPAARVVVSEAEIVAFDNGRESPGGAVPFTAPRSGSLGQ